MQQVVENNSGRGNLTGKRRWEPLPIVLATILALLLALVLLPVVALAVIAFGGTADIWPHLLRYVLPNTAIQTAGLLILVGLGTSILGVGTAWLTTLCKFPGRQFFSWSLMLPLAIPTYIAAYCQVELFDYTGVFQQFLRDVGGYSTSRDYWFPDIRSLGGAGMVFSAVLYPYVFLTSRLTFSMQGASVLDVSRTLGASPLRMFWKVGLPMARPAIVAGVALVLMETLNDIGAVEYLGVKTLTFAVFDTWLNRDSLGGAVQLAMILLVLVVLLIWTERHSQFKRSYANTARERPPARLELSPAKQFLAFLACTLPLAIGFGAPLFVLTSYALRRMEQIFSPALWSAAGNSILVAILSAGLAVIVAYTILLTARLSGQPIIARIGRLASLGYAIPGTVLAIGLLVPLAGFDNILDTWMRDWFGYSTGLLLTGSIFTLVYACTVRFLAISWAALETGFSRISPNVDMAARALGRSPWQLVREIHTPLLKPALGAAFLLVFVDTTKELSATLLLRPFGFETLATLIYDHAAQAAVEDAAFAALTIILIGLIPVVFLTRLSVGGKR